MLAMLAGASLLVPDALANHAFTGKRPNLLFVFSDQHSWDMLGCYGNRQIQTPHLDRFAAQGVRFDHCVSSVPVCSPMRAMLMTGN
jgi:arylsulfatase A-like enzyme